MYYISIISPLLLIPYGPGWAALRAPQHELPVVGPNYAPVKFHSEAQCGTALRSTAQHGTGLKKGSCKGNITGILYPV